jgi:hypothetical protein
MNAQVWKLLAIALVFALRLIALLHAAEPKNAVKRD